MVWNELEFQMRLSRGVIRFDYLTGTKFSNHSEQNETKLITLFWIIR